MEPQLQRHKPGTTETQCYPIFQQSVDEEEDECTVTITENTEQPEVEDQADSTLQTKLAKAILKALGTNTMSEELLSCWTVFAIKSKYQNMTPQILHDHKRLICNFKQQLH